MLVLEHALQVLLKCCVLCFLQVQALCGDTLPVVADFEACLPLSCSGAPVQHNIAIKQGYRRRAEFGHVRGGFMWLQMPDLL